MRKLRTAHVGFNLVGIDNAFLDLSQHGDGLLHFGIVSKCHGHRIMDHQKRSRCHQHRSSCHRNDGCSRCCNAINFDSHIALVIHKHGINLTCSHTVTSRTVQPDGHRSFASEKFITEHLRRDIIVKPTILCDSSVKLKNALGFLFGLPGFRCQIRPLPELSVLHRSFPPFLILNLNFVYYSSEHRHCLFPPAKAGACCH